MIQKDVWYNSVLFSVLMGATVTILIFILTNIINYYKERKSNAKKFLDLLMQQYSELFSIIYQGYVNPNNIDYINLRKQLDKNMSIVFLLPKELQSEISKLITVYFTNGEYYDNHKDDIKGLLSNIVKALKKYGVDTFGL